MEFQDVFLCLFVCVFLAQYFGKTVGLENVLFTFTFLGPDRENFGERPLFESLLSGSFCPTCHGSGWGESEDGIRVCRRLFTSQRPGSRGGDLRQEVGRPFKGLPLTSSHHLCLLGFQVTRRKAVKTAGHFGFTPERHLQVFGS